MTAIIYHVLMQNKNKIIKFRMLINLKLVPPNQSFCFVFIYLLNGKKEKCRGIYIYNSKYKHGFWVFLKEEV